jgi:transposase-like protein
MKAIKLNQHYKRSIGDAMDDFSIHVRLACPTCGCTEFESGPLKGDKNYTDDWSFTCTHCGRAFTHKELIEANAGSIDAAVDDMKDEIIDAAARELKKAFKG